MRNFKRIISMLIAVAVIFSLSVSAFAFTNQNGYYTFEAKMLDSEGNVITSAPTGTDAYLAVYFYETADTEKANSIEIERNASSGFTYDLDVPADMFADKSTLEGAYETAYDATVGSANITDWVADTGCFTIFNSITMSTGGTVNPKEPIAKHKISLGAVGTYEINFYETLSAQSGTMPAMGIKTVNIASFEITEAGQGGGSTVTATAAGAANAAGVTAYTITGDADVSKVLVKTFTKYADTEITDTTRVYVTIDGEPRQFGSDYFASVKGLKIGKLTFGIIYNGELDMSKVTEFEVR